MTLKRITLKKLLENMYVVNMLWVYLVRMHVYIQVGKIPNLDIHKGAITDVLMACQNYMRDNKVLSR